MQIGLYKKRPSLRRIIFVLCLIPLSVVFIFYWMFPHVFNCYMIDYKGFIVMGDHIYISDQMPKSLHGKILGITAESSERIEAFWGEMKSKPIFIFCATEDEFHHFGQNSGTPAMIHTTFLGAYVIVQPDGTNVDVVSHEICHAELSERLHWDKRYQGVPAWFNEGLALMVDYRFPQKGGGHSHEDYLNHWIFREDSARYMPLSEIEHIHDFFAKDEFWTKLSYMRSGLEVSRWLEIVGHQGVKALISRINDGRSFQKAYKEIEQESEINEVN